MRGRIRVALAGGVAGLAMGWFWTALATALNSGGGAW